MIKAIIFDVDGVLFESFNIKTDAFARLYDFAGEAAAQQGVSYHVENGGVSRYEKIKHFYREILKEDLSDERYNELLNQYSELVVEEVLKAPFVPGAKEFLDAYRKTYTYFIASGTPQDELRQIIQDRNLASYFKGVFGSPKKKGEHASYILNQFDLKPEEVAFIGDAQSDYKAAEQYGLHFVARLHEDNIELFKEKECIKMPDLKALDSAIESF